MQSRLQFFSQTLFLVATVHFLKLFIRLLKVTRKIDFSNFQLLFLFNRLLNFKYVFLKTKLFAFIQSCETFTRSQPVLVNAKYFDGTI